MPSPTPIIRPLAFLAVFSAAALFANARARAAAPPDLAAPAATRPAGESTAAAPRRPRVPRPERPDRNAPIDFDEVAAFMRDVSPRRWEAYQRLQENANLEPERKARLREGLINYYRGLQWLRREGNEPLLAARKAQIAAEDRIFEARLSLREAGGPRSRSAPADQARAQLRQAVADQVAARIEEHKLRVERLRQALAAEEARLQRQQAAHAALVDQEYQAILDGKAPPLFAPDRPDRSERPDRPDRPRNRQPATTSPREPAGN